MTQAPLADTLAGCVNQQINQAAASQAYEITYVGQVAPRSAHFIHEIN
jgi:hypothetical protein